MRNLKKFLALVLAMMMVFSLMVTVNAATTNEDYAKAYKQMASYGVFNGVTGGEAALTHEFTRAQMAAVAYRIATGDVEDDQIDLYAAWAAEQFTDVKETDWFAGYVGFCANKGIVVGVGNKKFSPNSQVTGMQAACMMLRLLGYGKTGEYEGKNWSVNVGADARRYNITRNLTDASLNAGASRGLAAYIARNGATIPNMVTYVYGDKYEDNGLPLITPNTDSGVDYDVWEAPESTTVEVTFNWVQGGVTYDIEAPVTPDYESYVAETECEVYDKSDETVEGTYAVYLNGYAWPGAPNTDIVAINTVDLIGAQGRWTRIYNDPDARIVYVDTFLAVVTNTVDEIRDPAGHVITPDIAYLTVYNGGYGAATANIAILNTEGYARGDVLRLNATTGATLARLPAATTIIEPDEEWVYNVEKITPTPVTIASVGVDIGGLGYSITGTNGTTYLYNVTFGYNSTSGAVTTTKLNSTYVGTTVDLYLDAKGNVLGVSPGATNYGVITKAATIQDGINGYYNMYEIVLADGTTTQIMQVNTDGKLYNSIAAATAGNTPGAVAAGLVPVYTLVQFDPNPNGAGYYNLTTAGVQDANVASGVEAGKRDTLSSVTGAPRVNNNTVFFVAQYTYNENTLNYAFAGYKPIKGFTAITDLNVSAITNFADSGPQPNVQVDVIASGGYASYVVVNFATKQSTPPVVGTVPNYAYIQTNAYTADVTNSYWTYRAVLNGTVGDLKVTRAGGAVAPVQSGLYTYTTYTNDVYQLLPGTGTPTLVNDAGQTWTYNAGVLENTASMDQLNGPQITYLTVDTAAQVYLINPTTGASTKLSSLSVLNVAPYSGYQMYYQFNSYGWINLIYLVGEAPATVAPTSGTVSVANPTYSVAGNTVTLYNANVTGTGDAVGEAFTARATIYVFNTNTFSWQQYSVVPCVVSGTVGAGGTINSFTSVWPLVPNQNYFADIYVETANGIYTWLENFTFKLP